MVAEHEQYERGRVRSASGGSEMVTTRLAMTLAVLLASGSAAAQDIRDVDLCALPLDRPMRAVHAGGNWGNNRQTVEAWEGEVSEPLVPPDYVAFLQDLRVNWVGLSVALHYEDSMDSTIERVYSTEIRIPTFSDRALRQYIREFKEYGFDVYLTLAFESFEAETAQRPVNRGQLGRPAVPDYGPTIRPENWPWLLPALSLLPGHTPAQAARRRAAPDTATSGPASIRMAQADTRSIPGDRFEQATLFRVRRQSVGDVPVELVHAPGKRVVFVQQVGEQHAIRFA